MGGEFVLAGHRDGKEYMLWAFYVCFMSMYNVYATGGTSRVYSVQVRNILLLPKVYASVLSVTNLLSHMQCGRGGLRTLLTEDPSAPLRHLSSPCHRA